MRKQQQSSPQHHSCDQSQRSRLTQNGKAVGKAGGNETSCVAQWHATRCSDACAPHTACCMLHAVHIRVRIKLCMACTTLHSAARRISPKPKRSHHLSRSHGNRASEHCRSTWLRSYLHILARSEEHVEHWIVVAGCMPPSAHAQPAAQWLRVLRLAMQTHRTRASTAHTAQRDGTAIAVAERAPRK